MSDLTATSVTCPRCGAQQGATVFSSLSADAIEAQAQAVLDGTFELMRCSRCDAPFRAEHELLYTSSARRLWVVMYPLSARGDFAAIERGVEETLARELEAAPPAAASVLRGLRPRLVFGQHMLTEAVRAARDGLDAPLLECAKLLGIRARIGELFPLGPIELCFEQLDDQGRLHLRVHRLQGAEPLGELTLPAELIAEVRESQPELEQRYPELFQRAYVSASRVLYGSQPGQESG